MAASDPRENYEDEIERLHQRINALSLASANRDRVYSGRLQRLWRELHRDRAKAERDATDRASQDPLTKAIASYLTPQATLADAQRVCIWLVKSFGRQGGQVVPYDRELASRLLLTKSLSRDEHQNWQKWGRLPDSVDVQHPKPRPEVVAQQERSVQVQAILAGYNPSPLALQHLARRR
jgi:hypothetical protein